MILHYYCRAIFYPPCRFNIWIFLQLSVTQKNNILRGRKSSAKQAYNFSDNISVNVESAFLLHKLPVFEMFKKKKKVD